jgi:S-adenosylmethionine:tRNA ribosyltransferase-isomerase
MDDRDTSYYDYQLAPDRIAQIPTEPRDAARLMVCTGALLDGTLALTARRVRDLPDLLEPGDLVVVNDTKVLPARLRLARPGGGAAEVLLLEPGPDDTWVALVRPNRRLRPGTVLKAPGEDQPAVEVLEPLEAKPASAEPPRRSVRLLDPDVVGRVGQLPLPPYITAPLADADRYQTVFANRPGSVAAPTASLHFTDDLVARLRERGVSLATIELQVGLATFSPIRVDRVEDHCIHTERYCVQPEVWAKIEEAPRVVAVGTTVVRTLETVAITHQLEGESDLYIRPGFDFQVVDVLMTNFHQPRSSLLVLVEAFAGSGWRQVYAQAQADGFRFLSFGDAMVVGRGQLRPPTVSH